MADKRYYWLKLKRDFFKRHDIKIVESLPNGKEYILFYLKLLCESVDHDGRLRFSDKIPYSEEMLATITNTNIDIVRSAVQLFSQLDMMDIMDDGTFFMNQVQDLIGSESYWAEKKRQQREQKKTPLLDIVQEVSNDCPTCPSKSKSKSKSKNNNINSSNEPDFEPDFEPDPEPDEPKPDIKSEFDELWKLYPRKQGKQKAYEAYRKARKKGTTYQQVMDGIEAYKRHCQQEKVDQKYVKMGSTFFNQQCWLDEYQTVAVDDDLDGIL